MAIHYIKHNLCLMLCTYYCLASPNAASDQATVVGGLVTNTVGGISIGLGVLGKISIGDNQTLSDLAKTAASEVALRAALATSYLTLNNMKFDVAQP